MRSLNNARGQALRIFTVLLGIIVTLVIVGASLSSDSSSVVAAPSNKCDGAVGNNQNGLNVEARHGNVFYIDSGQGQNVDASYVSYLITNTSSARSGLWAKVDTFTGGAVNLANPADASQPIGDLSTSAKTSAFFLLKANSSSSLAQSHVVRVFSGKPGLSGSTELYSCTFTFTKVAETIKALANKVTGISSTSVSTLGSTMTVTVTGATGTIGAGSSIDPGILWFSPAARSSWPTSAYRLVHTSINVVGTGNKDAGTYVNTLKITLAQLQSTSQNGNTKQFDYTATYTFRIVGPSATPASIVPIAQIASGTQIKHSDVTASGATATLAASAPSVNMSVTKNIAPTATISNSETQFDYTVTLNNTGSSSVTVDQITDNPAQGLTYVPGSVRFNNLAATGPGTLTGNSTQLFFPGPFTVPAGTSRTLTYSMKVTTCQVGSYSYQNSVVATVGNLNIGSGPAAMSLTTASGTCGDTQVQVLVSTVILPIEAVTGVASSITNTSATIFGSVDPNGDTGSQIRFTYGTSPTLNGGTSVNIRNTAGETTVQQFSTSLSGLSSGTIYYYRISAGDTNGSILSFVTSEPAGIPTATTGTVTDLVLVSNKINVTLNGSIDPNQITDGVKVKFEYATSNISNSCTSRGSSVFVPSTGFIKDETNADVILQGSFPTEIGTDNSVTGLTNNSWYCFRISGFYGSSYATVAQGEWVPFQALVKTDQTITFNGPSSLTNGDSWDIVGTTTSSLTITYESNTPEVCVIQNNKIVTVGSGTCSVTASQSGSTTFYAATPVTVNFIVNPGPPYITNAELLNGTVNSSYSETILAADGNGTYSQFSITSGSLPPGLSLNPNTGQITGTPTQSGTFSATYTVVSNGITSATKTLNIVINKKAHTLNVVNHVKTYGDTRTFSAGASSSASLSVTLSTSDTSIVTVSGGNITIVGVGTATITASSQGNDEFVDANQRTFTVRVDPAALTITAPSPVLTYGDSAPLYTPDASMTGLVYTDTSSVVTGLNCQSSYTSTTNAGTTPAVTCSGASASNYTISYVPGAVSISKALLTVTGESIVNRVYGTAPTTLSPVFTGWKNGQGTLSLSTVPSCTSSYSSTTPVSSSPVATTCSGGQAINYNFTYEAGSITLIKKTLTVTGPSSNLNYGDSIPSLTPIFSGFANNQNSSNLDTAPTCTTTYTATSNVSGSPFAVECGQGVSGNYSFNYVVGSISLSKKQLTITSPSHNVTYGDTPPTLTPVITGFVNNQSTSDIDTPPTCSASYSATTSVSSSPVTVNCLNAQDNNYSFAHSPGIITIAKKQLTITAESVTVTYGDAVPTINPSFTGFVNSQSRNDLSSQPVCITTYQLNSSVGTSPTTSCSGAGSQNYSFAYVNGAVTINKANQTLTFNPSTLNSLRPGGTSSIAAQSSSGLTPAVTASGECSYDSVNLEVIANGSIVSDPSDCTLTANIGSSTNFNAASPITLVVQITGPAKVARSLNAALSPQITSTTVDGDISLTSTLSPNAGTREYRSNTPSVCTINQNTGQITLVGIGTCSVMVEALEDNTYTSTSSQPFSFQVLSGNRTLTLSATPTSLPAGQSSILSTVLSRGGGNISFVVNSGASICSISGNRVISSQAGVCAIYATVPSNGNFSSTISNTVTIVFTANALPQAGVVPPRVNLTPIVTRPPQSPQSSSITQPNTNSRNLGTPPASPNASNSLPTPQVRAETSIIGAPVVTGAPVRTTNSVDTVDTGRGIAPGAPPLTSNSSGVRSIEAIKQETLSGFAPGVGTRIEIIGARTTGQFIITPGQIGDPVAISAAISESTSRTATNFAQITNVTPTGAPSANRILSGPVTEDAIDIFAASALDRPVTVGSLNIDQATSWIRVNAQVATYKPGSVVYLAVTTSPIIFGSAIVGDDGKVTLSGDLPLSLLSEGGHNIRLVGVRELGGVEASEDGSIVLSDQTLEEIRRFDEGSKATVRLVGANESGGVHAVVREIPLEKVIPWWTLWLLLAVSGLALLWRLVAKRWTFFKRVASSTILGVAGLFPIIAGWITASYNLLFIGLAVAAIMQVIVWVLPHLTFRRKSEN